MTIFNIYCYCSVLRLFFVNIVFVDAVFVEILVIEVAISLVSRFSLEATIILTSVSHILATT